VLNAYRTPEFKTGRGRCGGHFTHQAGGALRIRAFASEVMFHPDAMKHAFQGQTDHVFGWIAPG